MNQNQPNRRPLPLLAWLAIALGVHVLLYLPLAAAFPDQSGGLFWVLAPLIWIPAVVVGRKDQAVVSERNRQRRAEYERARQAHALAERESRKVVVGNWYGYRGE
jgi:hypothetical protein